MAGFEWSTGSGTMWLLSRVRSLISVEHHASWANRVKDSLERILPSKCAATLGVRRPVLRIHAVLPLR